VLHDPRVESGVDLTELVAVQDCRQLFVTGEGFRPEFESPSFSYPKRSGKR